MKEKQRTLVQAVQVSEALRVENNDMLRQLQVDAGDSTGGSVTSTPVAAAAATCVGVTDPFPPTAATAADVTYPATQKSRAERSPEMVGSPRARPAPPPSPARSPSPLHSSHHTPPSPSPGRRRGRTDARGSVVSTRGRARRPAPLLSRRRLAACPPALFNFRRLVRPPPLDHPHAHTHTHNNIPRRSPRRLPSRHTRSCVSRSAPRPRLAARPRRCRRGSPRPRPKRSATRARPPSTRGRTPRRVLAASRRAAWRTLRGTRARTAWDVCHAPCRAARRVAWVSSWRDDLTHFTRSTQSHPRARRSLARAPARAAARRARG